MATNTQPTPTLLDRIREQENILLGLWTSFITLKAFERALVKRIGESRFVVANSIVWEAMLAKRDLLMIRFASWIRGVIEQGGFLRQLQANHFPELRQAWKNRKPTATDPVGVITEKHRGARIEARFPTAVASGQFQPADLEAVKDAVRKHFAPVVDDRDNFRAHPHDGDEKPNAKALGLADVEPFLIAAQDLMNDLRLLVHNSTFGYHGGGSTDPNTAADDLVDLLLFHGFLQMMMFTGANERLNATGGVYWWQLREKFLAELAKRHAEHPELPINDPSLVHAASEAISAKP